MYKKTESLTRSRWCACVLMMVFAYSVCACVCVYSVRISNRHSLTLSLGTVCVVGQPTSSLKRILSLASWVHPQTVSFRLSFFSFSTDIRIHGSINSHRWHLMDESMMDKSRTVDKVWTCWLLTHMPQLYSTRKRMKWSNFIRHRHRELRSFLVVLLPMFSPSSHFTFHGGISLEIAREAVFARWMECKTCFWVDSAVP